MARMLQQRLAAMGVAARVETDRRARALVDRPLLAVVSSRLGTSYRRHARVCRYLIRSMIEARQSGQVLLVAAGSAIEPWALRAAELYGVPLVRVTAGCANDAKHRRSCWPTVAVDANANRDALVIAMADRVDCVLVRPRGTIDTALRKRLRCAAGAPTPPTTSAAAPSPSITTSAAPARSSAVNA